MNILNHISMTLEIEIFLLDNILIFMLIVRLLTNSSSAVNKPY